CFLTILTLFAINVGFFSWSNVRRRNSVEQLQQALTAQRTLGEIQENLNNIQKQVTLLSQSVVDAESGASHEEIEQFRAQLDEIRSEIRNLRVNSRGYEQSRTALEKSYAELSASWLKFYQNFGVHHATAILELAMHAEPLGQQVRSVIVPELLDSERRNVEL